MRGRGRVVASRCFSSDELNNKRCKYDNFSQDVASNNKIKIIPQRSAQKSQSRKVRKVRAQSQLQAEEWGTRNRGRSGKQRVRHSDNSTTGGQFLPALVDVGRKNSRKIFNSSHPSCSVGMWIRIRIFGDWSNCVWAEVNLIDLFFMPKRITRCRRGADYR